MTTRDETIVPLESCPKELVGLTNIVSQMFSKFGRCGAMAYVMASHRMEIIDCESFVDHRLPPNRIKNAVEAIIIKLVQEGAEWVGFSDEAWTVHADGKEAANEAINLAQNNRLNEHPDRVEILMVTLSTPQGDWHASAEIVREEGKPARHLPWKVRDMTKFHEYSGRFTKFWSKASTATGNDMAGVPSRN